MLVLTGELEQAKSAVVSLNAPLVTEDVCKADAEQLESQRRILPPAKPLLGERYDAWLLRFCVVGYCLLFMQN